MKSNYFLTSLLPLLAAASPIEKRAGGPAIVPIPSNCTIINPLPHAACGTANVNGWMPASNESLLYSAYFDGFLNQSEQAEQCLEQCYGYGNPGQCKSAFVGYQIPTPPGYFGTNGGDLETACLLYSTYSDPTNFTVAPAGQYLNATAGNIYCPSPRAAT